jgi:predicted ATPase
MIKRIYLDNFKAMLDFQMSDIESFVCLVGLNGAGKTTFLQACDFLGQLIHGNMKLWLANRGWEAADLRSKLGSKLNITYEVDIELDGYGLVTWKGTYQVAKGWSTDESVTRTVGTERETIFKTAGSRISMDGETKDIAFDLDGSILSRQKLIQGKHDLLITLKAFLLSLKSLELLSPHLLRSTSRQKTGDIGLGGEHLPVFLSSLDATGRKRLISLLNEFYPHLTDWEIRSQQYGWKSLVVNEVWKAVPLSTSSRHVNDGFLRLTAILAQAMGQHQVLLYDEIENGITPELIEKLVDFLVGCGKQVIITTHSPMILNYLPDDIARKSVYLLYRNDAGGIKSLRYFDHPETSRKLEFLGPGEVYVDTPIAEVIPK